MNIEAFLQENRLAEHLPLIKEGGYDLQDLLDSDEEALLALVGGKKAHLERLKRGLAELSSASASAHPTGDLAALAGDLPMVLSLPALELAGEREHHPVLRLWALCDLVELGARLAVVAGLAEHGGNPPSGLREALAQCIERPTLGKWLQMARAVAEHLPENPAFPALAGFVSNLDTELCPLEGTQDFKRSALALRNRLAHGGGLNQKAAREILSAWESRFERLTEIFSPWRDFQMVSFAADGTGRLLRGSEAIPWDGDPATDAAGKLCAFIGGRRLDVWPLLANSQDGDESFSGIYSRRGEVRLEYTPFEGNLAVLETEVHESFLDLFHRTSPKAASAFQYKESTEELQKEAARRIGREEEFDRLLDAIRNLPTGGLLWVGGVAGMGKSCLMASATVALLEQAPAQTMILPYRFKAGDGRCSVGEFLGYATERIEAWDGLDQEQSGKIKEDASPQKRFLELIRCVKNSWEILVVADGLDELPPTSDLWLHDVIIASAKSGSRKNDEGDSEEVPSRIGWALAGRPERGIQEKLRKAGAVDVFPEGLPPMRPDDVRSFFFERLSRSKTRSRLVGRDEEKGGATVNPFLEEVVRRSEGLPVYMNHVVGDLITNKITPDQEGQLPKGLAAYHEELLRRCAVGDLQAVMTPLVALLALAHDPLDPPALACLLRRAGRTDTENVPLIEKALAGVSSMIRRSPNPDGRRRNFYSVKVAS